MLADAPQPRVGFAAKGTLLVTSSLTVMAGATISPALPEIGRRFADVPNSALLVELVLTVPGLFIALSAPFMGMLMDAIGRKSVLVFVLALYAVGGASGLFVDDIWLLLLGRAVLGVAVAGVTTGCLTLIADYFSGEERQQFLGTQAAFMGLGAVVFLLAGGFLAEVSWRAPFGIYLASLVVMIAAVAFLPEPSRPLSSATNLGAVQEPIPYVTAGFLYLMALLGMAIFYQMPTKIPVFLETTADASPRSVGMVMASAMLVSSTVSFCFGPIRRVFSPQAIFAFLFACMGGAYIAIGQSEEFEVIFGFGLMAGLGMGFMMPNINSWLASIAPDRVRGRLMGILGMSIFLGQFLSPILVRPIADTNGLAGYDGVFAVVGYVCLTLSAGFLVSLPFIRKTKDSPLPT